MIKGNIGSPASLIGRFHVRVFGHEMGEEMRVFLNNLSWSFLGGAISSGAMLFVNVLGGRFMGPEQYGFYGLVLAVSQVIMLPAIFGMDIVGLRFLSRSRDKEDRSENLTTIAVSVFLSSAAMVVVFLGVSLVFRGLVPFGVPFLVIVSAYSLLTVYRTVSDVFFRGLGLFRRQFLARMIESALTVLTFSVIFLLFRKTSYPAYVSVLMIGYGGFVAYGLSRFRPYFSRFRRHLVKEYLSYAWIIVLGAVSGTAFNAMDKFIIARYLSIEELGIYIAYFTASTNLVAQATQMFVNAYFPAVSRISDFGFVRKLDKILVWGSVPMFLSVSAVVYGIMLLFGTKYGHDIRYVVSFGLLASLQVALTVYSSTIMALSKELYRRYVTIFNAINVFHLAGYGILVLLGKVSILALVYMFVANVAVAIGFQRWLIGRAESGLRP